MDTDSVLPTGAAVAGLQPTEGCSGGDMSRSIDRLRVAGMQRAAAAAAAAERGRPSGGLSSQRGPCWSDAPTPTRQAPRPADSAVRWPRHLLQCRPPVVQIPSESHPAMICRMNMVRWTEGVMDMSSSVRALNT